MKAKIRNKKYKFILLATISLIIGFCIDFYYSSYIPDFDIGFYEAFTRLKCWIFILLTWSIELGVLRTLKKRTNSFASITVMVVYWLMVWGFCYYQYLIKAIQDWNDMTNGT